MAILPVEKVHIVVHKSIQDSFLHALQKEGIVHITERAESSPKVPEKLTRVNNVLDQLSKYKKRTPLAMFFSIKQPLSYDEFIGSKRSFDEGAVVEELEGMKKERDRLSNNLHHVETVLDLLEPWLPLKIDLEELFSFRLTEAIPVIIPAREILDVIQETICDMAVSFELINTRGMIHYGIFFTVKERGPRLRAHLIENECEIIDFRGLPGTPAALIQRHRDEMEKIQKRIEELNQREAVLSKEIRQLETTSDRLTNEHRGQDVAAALPDTARTVHIIGWIMKRHLQRLDALIDGFEFAYYERVEPEPDERSPVALQNTAFSKPYEMLIHLYSMPHPREYDPTPFLAVFFPIMFGLCITDAVYGIILILISLYLMSRVSGDKSLFKILLIGGSVTILAGAMVGSWVGDIFNYIGFEPLLRLKNALMLFDPVKQPMVFIALALGLGFIHMMIGIGIEIIDNMKNKEYNQAIFANLTWFIIIPSIVLYSTVFSSSLMAKAILELVLWICVVGIIIASHPEGHPAMIDQLVWAPLVFFAWYVITSFAFGFLNIEYVIRIPHYVYLTAIPLLIFEIIRHREMKKVLGKMAWGLYNLYGISNYLGVLLSYVRLMALGMVTGVIAIAINKIAWMITGIPVVGVLLVVIILIPSHLFNLVINTLGGFIHTMRLQYIEFFGRFYQGGSRPFKPFQIETNYVEIR